MLPKDPVILLSTVNTRLRDVYSSLEELCKEEGITKKDLDEALSLIGYVYDEQKNAYV